MLFGLVYVVGMGVVAKRQVNLTFDDWENSREDFLREVWNVLTISFWPVWLVGKLLAAPVDRLLLPPPGDGV